MREMRILGISSLYPHGNNPNYGVFVHNRYNTLAKMPATTVTMLTPFPQSFLRDIMPRYKKISFKPGFNSDRVKVIPFPYFSVPKFLKQFEYFSAMKWIKGYANQLWITDGPFDVIDVQWGFPDLMIGTYLSELWDIPLNFTLRGEETFYLGTARGALVQAHIQSVHGITALSERLRNTANELNCEFGIDKKFLIESVIPNGTDVEKFTYRLQSDARKTLSIPENQVVLLSVGTLVTRKGFDRVILSLDAIKQAVDENVHYYIIGGAGPEGNDEELLRTLVEVNGLQNHVTFVGPVSNKDLPTWYQASDWFILSSLGEGSPNVLSEAMSCGCFSAGTDVGSAVDLLKRGHMESNILPTELDSDNFQNSLVKILKSSPRASDKERFELSSKMKQFSWDACAEETRVHLSNLIDAFSS